MKEVAQLFKALSDEARVKMLWLLLNHRELCVCDFMETLEITQSKASRHLRVLYNSKLITDRRDKNWIYYSLNEHMNPRYYHVIVSLKNVLAEEADAKRVLQRLEVWQTKKQADSPCSRGNYKQE